MAISTGAAILGSAAIGALAGSGGSGGGTTTTNSEPWKEQKPFLTYGFGQAQDAYKSALAQGAYTGDRVASLNPYQTQGADFTGNYALTTGSQGANALSGAGLSLLNSGSGFGTNANTIFNRASGDATQQILAAAGQYVNNPYVDGVVDAANRDTVRGLTEQQLPALMRQMTGTGNTNSTTGMKEGQILTRGAQDRMADMASNIRSQFFGQGLNMAQNQYNQNLQNMLAANAGVQNSFNLGGNAITMGQQAAGNVFDQANAAGSLYQTQNQNQLTANQQAFNEQRDLPMSLAQQYMQTVGGNYGGTTTSTAPTVGGGFGGALLGGLGAGLSAYGTIGKLGGFSTMGSSPYSLASGAGGLGLKAPTWW